MATVTVVAYNGNTDAPMAYNWTIETSGSTISLTTCRNRAPAGLVSNYDYTAVRNYSSWITYSGTSFYNLSSTQVNYINLWYVEKDIPLTYYCNAYAGTGIDSAWPSVPTVEEGGSCTFRCSPSRGYVFSYWYGNDGYVYDPTFTKSRIHANQAWTAYGSLAVRISTGSASESGATIYISGNSSYPYVRLYYRKTIESNGEYTNWAYIPNSGSINVSGLESGTEYIFRCFFNSSADGTTQIISNTITLTTMGPAVVFTATALIESGYEQMIDSVSANPTSVLPGRTSTFTAVIRSGYVFSGWYTSSGQRVSDSNPYTATLTDNLTLYARATSATTSFQWDNNNNLDNRRPTANEWNRLIRYIEQKFGVTVSQSSKNSVIVGGTLSASLFNELASDVGYAMVVSRGTPISRAILYTLQNEANR